MFTSTVECRAGLGRGEAASELSNIASSNPFDRFRAEAAARLDWFECELALLSPASPDYGGEKQAIQAAVLPRHDPL